MATFEGIEDDIELNVAIPVTNLLEQIESDPAILAYFERISRQQNLKLARRVGNTSGKYAQRQLPQGVLKQVPGNQRIF